MWRFLLPPVCRAEAMGFSARRAVKGNEQGTQAGAKLPPSLGATSLETTTEQRLTGTVVTASARRPDHPASRTIER
jgi:hypothetical protein